jgi:hypothetical protein
LALPDLQWFQEDDAAPFVIQAFQILEEKRVLIPCDDPM